ncbi:1090_t:CDS:2 [Gigaspora margarita]|uniref:1090_t:CDS:1 n=1 Tax=Gigaspora margarita TaxID=4874 RepID=A0ABN7WDN5_GIGMA|nr:1090_t:CDS:2 [Gigaspora margarita]
MEKPSLPSVDYEIGKELVHEGVFCSTDKPSLPSVDYEIRKELVHEGIIIENNLKALGFIEQKTPKKDDFKEEDLISEILGNGQRPTTTENKIYSIVDCFETPRKKKNKPNKKTPRKMTNRKRRGK